MDSKNQKVLEKILGRKVTLGSTLKSERLCRDLSQEEFGEILGVSKQYLSNIENNRKTISINQAINFAEKLGFLPLSFVSLALEQQLLEAGFDDYKIELKKIG